MDAPSRSVPTLNATVAPSRELNPTPMPDSAARTPVLIPPSQPPAPTAQTGITTASPPPAYSDGQPHSPSTHFTSPQRAGSHVVSPNLSNAALYSDPNDPITQSGSPSGIHADRSGRRAYATSPMSAASSTGRLSSADGSRDFYSYSPHLLPLGNREQEVRQTVRSSVNFMNPSRSSREPTTPGGIHPQDEWGSYLAARERRVDRYDGETLTRLAYTPNPASSSLSPTIPMEPNRRGTFDGRSPFPTSPLALSPIDGDPLSLLQPRFSVTQVKPIVEELSAFKAAYVDLQRKVELLEHAYATAGHALDLIYTSTCADNLEPDRPEGKRCKYDPIIVRASTQCGLHKGTSSIHSSADGLCTHPPWKGRITIDDFEVDCAGEHYRSTWKRAKFEVMRSLGKTIQDLVSRCHVAWDRASFGRPWGDRQLPVVGLTNRGEYREAQSE